MAQVELYRHAKAKKNCDPDIVGGRSNSSPLIVEGEAQADWLGDRFRREQKLFAAVYTSPAVRARSTAVRSLQRAGIVRPLIEHPGLQEISQGLWEGRNRHEELSLPDGTIEQYIHPYKRGLDGRVAGGESIADVGLRMESALLEIAAAEANPDAPIAVFTHDFALRCLRVRFTGNPSLISEGVGYCSVTIVEIDSAALSLTDSNFGIPQI